MFPQLRSIVNLRTRTSQRFTSFGVKRKDWTLARGAMCLSSLPVGWLSLKSFPDYTGQPCCEFADHRCCCKMARKFLTVEEAFEYMNSLSDEEFDDPKMSIISMEPDAVIDEEGIDDSFTNCNTDEICGDLEIRDTAGIIEVLSNICEIRNSFLCGEMIKTSTAKFPFNLCSESRSENAFHMGCRQEDHTTQFAFHESTINYDDIIDLQLGSSADVYKRTVDLIQFEISLHMSLIVLVSIIESISGTLHRVTVDQDV
ncbi:hypothetical protein HNY73_011821 [Argiope bruennichi]|uniref:Uncharacterized protein n=1 Tax=Argiope bruennichi TaxID=94029 RepID=A0A8T0EV12_ARGBR|nr:hypothetical protein HNY73_011821 [Argiope bruennichi]